MLTGRVQLRTRIAAEVKNANELCSVLERYLNGENSVECGLATDGNSSSDDEIIRLWKSGNRLAVGMAWAHGAKVDWRLLSPDGFRHIPAPVYPFAKSHYWLTPQVSDNTDNIQSSSILHPFLDENISTLKKLSFVKTISPDSFYINEHIVGGKGTLPGAVYIEMARAAGEIAFGRSIIMMKDIYLVSPVVNDRLLRLYIDIKGKADSMADFEIYTLENAERKLHAMGVVSTLSEEITNLDHSAVRASAEYTVSAKSIYETYEQIGIKYGEHFHTINKAQRNSSMTEGWTEVAYIGDTASWNLHPSLLDGVLQSPGILCDFAANGDCMPFYFDSVAVYGNLPQNIRVYVTAVRGTLKTVNSINFDIDVTDMAEQLVMQIRGLNARQVKADKQDVYSMSDQELMSFLETINP
jgi:hypothetical protein